MSIKSSVDVIIQNYQFTIVECAPKTLKKNAVLHTLKKIEEAMRKNLNYSHHAHDEYSKLPKELLWKKLLEEAKSIRDRYMQTDLQTRAIKKARKRALSSYERIEKLATALPSLNLPRELIQHVFGFLPFRELVKMTQVSKFNHEMAKKILIPQANDCGYIGNNFSEAKNYLNQMSQAIGRLVQNGHISRKYIVMLNHSLLPRDIDVHATFEKIKNLAPSEREVLKTALTEHLFEYFVTGNWDIINFFLKIGVNPDKTNDKKETLLHQLTSLCFPHDIKYEIMKLLLSYKANPNIPNKDGLTPIYVSTYYPEITELLCTKNANVNQKTNSDENTPLHFATAKVQLKTAKVLLKYGANPNVKNKRNETPLYLAMSLGCKPEVKKELVSLLLSYKADPNVPNNEGFTPICVDTSCPEITELLCQKNANVNQRTNPGGDYPLHFAIKNEEIETAKVLLKHGANPNVQNNKGETPLYFAMYLGFAKYSIKEEAVSLLLSYGADPNISNKDGFTPICVNTNYPELTELLCQKNANVNQKTEPDENYPFHYAAKNAEVKMAEIFLRYGANPNVKNKNGKTPLHVVRHFPLSNDHKEFIELLLNNGADPNIPDNDGLTPITAHINDPEIIELLCKGKADVNQKIGLEENYPLHLAVMNNQVKTASILLKYGVNPNVQNKEGETPLFLVLNKKTNSINKKLVSLLLNHGADPNIPNNDGFTPICIDTSDLEFTELFCEEKINVSELQKHP